jgi:hypothetical protein
MKSLFRYFSILLLINYQGICQSPSLDFAFSAGGSPTGKVERIVRVLFDASGNKIMVGHFSGEVDFDFGSSITTLNTGSTSLRGVFMASYAPSGTLNWVKNFMGNGLLEAIDFDLDASNNIIIKGSFDFTCDFDPSAAVANLTASSGGGFFIAKYSNVGNYLWAIQTPEENINISKSMDIDAGGNIYMTGTFAAAWDFDPSAGTTNLTPAGVRDMFLAKYTASGALAWAKKIGSSGVTVIPKSLALGNDGNLVVAGTFNFNTDFDPSPAVALISTTTEAAFMAKYSTAACDIQWVVKRVGVYQSGTPLNLEIDASNNIYMVGMENFNTDGFVSKYNSNGFLSFQFVLGRNINFPNLVDGQVIMQDIELDANGDFYVSGLFRSTSSDHPDFDPSSTNENRLSTTSFHHYFYAKYTTAGNFLWANKIDANLSISSTLDTRTDRLESITLYSSNLYICGVSDKVNDFDPSAALVDPNVRDRFYPFEVSYASATGSYNNYRIFPYNDGGDDFGLKVTSTTDNQWISAGTFRGVVDFDPSINTFNMTTPLNGENSYLAKHNAVGGLVWVKNLGNAKITAIKNNTANETYVLGTFRATVDFDPSPATFNLTAFGSSSTVPDIFLAKYSSVGDLIWAKQIGGIQDDFSQSMDLYANGDIVISGTFEINIDLDPSAATATLNSTNAVTNRTDIFFAKYDANGAYVWGKNIGGGYGFTTTVSTDLSNNIFLGGGFRVNLDLDPSANAVTIFSQGSVPVNLEGFLAKYDPSGNFLWGFGLGSNQDDQVNNVKTNSTGEVLVGGFIASTSRYLKKYNTSGIELWSVGSSNTLVKIDANGSIYTFGLNANKIERFNQAGTNIGIFTFANTSFRVSDLAHDSNNDFLITGSFRGSNNLDLAGGTFNLIAPTANDDIYWAKYNFSAISSITNGDWATATTWNCNCTPAANNIPKINHTVSVPNAGNTIKKIQLNGGKINLAGGKILINN